MKNLLYIPNGTYLSFYRADEVMVNLGEYEAEWKETAENIINMIIKGDIYADTFYERNFLPKPEFLDISQFHVVEEKDK